jgi:hypothetical protein
MRFAAYAGSAGVARTVHPCVAPTLGAAPSRPCVPFHGIGSQAPQGGAQAP